MKTESRPVTAWDELRTGTRELLGLMEMFKNWIVGMAAQTL